MRTLATLMAAALVCVASASCPASCTCRWKNGKETVECVGAGLTSLPAGVQVGTQVLDLSGNSLHVLPKDMFVAPGLLNLQRIYLAGCKIGRIDDLAFSRLSNLVELDLGNNLITAVPSETFRDFTSLRRLVLSDNPITRVENAAFVHLPVLATLEMSRCLVDTVTPRAFDGLAHLTSLKLDKNRLAHIPSAALAHLKTLHGVELHGNPWRCDCHLLDLQDWLMRSGVPYGAPLICVAPNSLRGVRIEQVPNEDLACAPVGIYFRPRMRQAEASVGDSVSLLCQVSGIPEPFVRWLWQGKVIANLSGFAHRPRMFVIHENGTTVKASVLTMSEVDEEDADDYVCVAENSAGRFVTNFTLVVLPKTDEETAGLTGTQVAGIGVGLVVMALVIVVLLWVMVERWRQNSFGAGKHVTVNKMGSGKSARNVHQRTELHIDREQYELKGSTPSQHGKRTEPTIGYANNTNVYDRHPLENSVGGGGGHGVVRVLANQPDVVNVNSDHTQCAPTMNQRPEDASEWQRQQCLPGRYCKTATGQWREVVDDAESTSQADDNSWRQLENASTEDWDEQRGWYNGGRASPKDLSERDTYGWHPTEEAEDAFPPPTYDAAGVTNPFGDAKNLNFRLRHHLVPVLPPFPPEVTHSPDEGYEDEGEEGTEV